MPLETSTRSHWILSENVDERVATYVKLKKKWTVEKKDLQVDYIVMLLQPDTPRG